MGNTQCCSIMTANCFFIKKINRLTNPPCDVSMDDVYRPREVVSMLQVYVC